MFSSHILQEQHLGQYQQLRLKSYQESPYAFSESYEDESKKSSVHFLQELKVEGEPPEQFVLGIFKQNKILIGFVKFRRDKRSKARHKSMIHAMYIDPAYRQLGLGKKLIDDLLSFIRKIQGLEQIHLWVLHASDSAAPFYQACGFESQGTVVKKDLKIGKTYIDAEYMVLYLETSS